MAASCKFMHSTVDAEYYATDVCKTCTSLATLLASFITGVISFSCKLQLAGCNFYRTVVMGVLPAWWCNICSWKQARICSADWLYLGARVPGWRQQGPRVVPGSYERHSAETMRRWTTTKLVLTAKQIQQVGTKQSDWLSESINGGRRDGTTGQARTRRRRPHTARQSTPCQLSGLSQRTRLA